MILRLYRAYKTGKTIYTKLLKPFYEELKKDADKFETAEKRKRNRKKVQKRKKTNQIKKTTTNINSNQS